MDSGLRQYKLGKKLYGGIVARETSISENKKHIALHIVKLYIPDKIVRNTAQLTLINGIQY